MSVVVNDFELDTLCEVINIGIGRAGSILNEMLGAPISLSVPKVEIITPEKLLQRKEIISPSNRYSAVELGFKGNVSGKSFLVFNINSATKLVEALTKETVLNFDMDEIMAGTLMEVGNIIINSVIGSIANIAQYTFEYTIPEYKEANLTEIIGFKDLSQSVYMILAKTFFAIEQLQIEGEMIFIFEVGAIDYLLTRLRTNSSTNELKGA